MTDSIPTVSVKRLNPEFERLVRGPVRRPAAIAEIETVASLTRDFNLSRIASIQRASIPYAEVKS